MEPKTCEKGYLEECRLDHTIRHFLAFALEATIIPKETSAILEFLEKPWHWNNEAKMWVAAGHPEPESALGQLVWDKSYGEEIKLFTDEDYAESLRFDASSYPPAVEDFRKGATNLGMDETRISNIINMATKSSEKGAKHPAKSKKEV